MPTDGFHVGERDVIGPVPPEERVAEHVGAARDSLAQRAYPRGVRPLRHNELVQVGEHDVARRRHVAIQTVVESRHLRKIVHFRWLALVRRPRVDEHRKWPRYDVDELFVLHGAQVLPDAVSARVVVKDEVGGAEHPVHFDHLRQLVVVVEAEVERRHTHLEVVRRFDGRAHRMHVQEICRALTT